MRWENKVNYFRDRNSGHDWAKPTTPQLASPKFYEKRTTTGSLIPYPGLGLILERTS